MPRIDELRLDHETALTTSLQGHHAQAEELFLEVIEGYSAEGSQIDVGRAERDLVRVYAGLGDGALRAVTMHHTLEVHRETLDKNNPDSQNELAASLHVGARLELAQSAEETHLRHGRIQAMAEKWREAHGLLLAAGDLANHDYAEQIAAHGGSALAVFGKHSRDVDFAYDLTAGVINAETSQKRRQAIRLAQTIVAFRILPKIPVHRLPPIRRRVFDEVAGPYVIR